MPRVIISSGHTSTNPGVILNGLQEYELARKIAKYALKFIRQNGIISLSVPPNLELQQRIAWINKTGYLRETNDIAIEVHINDGGRSGLEAWFEGEGGNPSQGIANIVLDGLSRETGLPVIGAHSEFNHELGSIAFVHDLKPNSIVIECGFIDGDAEFLKNEANLEKCGRGIAKGVLNYFGLEYREAAPATTLVTTPQVQQNQAAPQTVQPIQTVQPGQPSLQQEPAASADKTPTLRSQSDEYDEEYDDYDDDLPAGWDDFSIHATPADSTNAINNTPVATVQPVTQPVAQPVTRPVTTVQPAPAATSNNYGFNQQQSYGFPAGGQSTGAYPSRDERKEMIIRNYVKILGREPNQNDLNYFLNIGIREDELIRKMVDSQEHLDLITAKEQLGKMMESYSKDKEELDKLKALTEDQKEILDQYNQSIEQKNIALTKLQIDIKELQQKLNQQPTTTKKTSAAKAKYKGTFKDKFFKAMSDLLE